MRPIDTPADLARDLAALLVLDPTLKPVADRAGPLPLRRHAPTLAGLIRIVVAQQVSVASAAAIFARLEARAVPFDTAVLAALSDADLSEIGLSRAKISTIRAVCQAVDAGLDLTALALLPQEAATARLVSIRGIGPWTAEIFLLFCAGHPDLFPAGDLALREAVRLVFGLKERPDIVETRERVRIWAPYRGTAARLMWAYYRVETGRGTTVPV